MFRTDTRRGFTLIELMVVITIIGLLASTVLVALGNARARARDARRTADIRQIMTALELYANDNGSGYPTGTGCSSSSSGCDLNTIESALVPSYIDKIPKDPSNTSSSTGYLYYVHSDSSGPASVNDGFAIKIDYEKTGDCWRGANVSGTLLGESACE